MYDGWRGSKFPQILSTVIFTHVTNKKSLLSFSLVVVPNVPQNHETAILWECNKFFHNTIFPAVIDTIIRIVVVLSTPTYSGWLVYHRTTFKAYLNKWINDGIELGNSGKNTIILCPSPPPQ